MVRGVSPQEADEQSCSAVATRSYTPALNTAMVVCLFVMVVVVVVVVGYCCMHIFFCQAASKEKCGVTI